MSKFEKVYVGLLLVVFGGIVLHAPLSVGLSTLWPDATLYLKSWKEVLMGLAAILALVILSARRSWGLLRTPLMYAIAGFALLNLLLVPLSTTGREAVLAGLLINLRFLLFFVLVYIAIRLQPGLSRLFLKVFAAGAALVVGFGILQVTVLPPDALKYIGYGDATIQPYLTVDANESYVRINSTLRGPNPLGAYAAIVLAMVLAAWLAVPRKLKRYERYVALFLVVGAAVALVASYSRSAALAALAAVGLVVMVSYGRKIPLRVWVALGVVGVLVVGSLAALRETQLVSQVLLHEDPAEAGQVNSNEEHAKSLAYGLSRLVQQPVGAGIGSTGSASLLSDKPLIIENQYLFVAHESGWLGLGLFVAIMYMVLAQLWQRRAQWLALGVFASGVGLALAGLVLPVWVDDTVSLVWWGLAAVALAVPVVLPGSLTSPRVPRASRAHRAPRARVRKQRGKKA